MAEYKMEDYSKLIAKMNNFSEEVQVKHAWGATRKGAQIIANAAKRNAEAIDDPESKINIADFINVQRAPKLGRSEKGVAYRIGVRGGAVYVNGERQTPTYWRFIELGTEHQAARPFLAPAGVNAAEAVIAAITKSLNQRLDKEAKK